MRPTMREDTLVRLAAKKTRAVEEEILRGAQWAKERSGEVRKPHGEEGRSG